MHVWIWSERVLNEPLFEWESVNRKANNHFDFHHFSSKPVCWANGMNQILTFACENAWRLLFLAGKWWNWRFSAKIFTGNVVPSKMGMCGREWEIELAGFECWMVGRRFIWVPLGILLSAEPKMSQQIGICLLVGAGQGRTGRFSLWMGSFGSFGAFTNFHDARPQLSH